MKTRRIGFSCLVAMALGTGLTAATAADLKSTPVYTKAPPPAAYGWSGFYMGGDIGSGWAKTSDLGFSDSGGPGATGVAGTNFGSQNFDLNKSGVIGGFYMGGNWQFAPSWLVGVEGDFNWASIKASHDSTLVGATPVASDLNLQSSVDFVTSIRGRAGYVYDNWLFYVTGGAAWADLNFSGLATVTDGTGGQAASTFTVIRPGFVVGGGVEWQAFATPWRARLEYLYYGFDNTSSGTGLWQGIGSTGAPCGATGACAAFHAGDVTLQTVRVGLSYAFHQ